MANYIRYANQGATRNKPLSAELEKALGYLGDMGITAEVFSGGQESNARGLGLGSTRHNHGNAADVRFYQGDRMLNWNNKDDVPVFQDIVRKGKAAGLTGFGAGPGYMSEGSMHLGFGTPAVWGAGGKGANAAPWLLEAYGLPAIEQPVMAKPVPSFDSLNAGTQVAQLPAAVQQQASLRGEAPAVAPTPAPKPESTTPTLDKLGTTIWGDKAGELKALFGEGANANNPAMKGLSLLGGAMKPAQQVQEAPIQSSLPAEAAADAQRFAGAQQLMASLINKKRGLTLNGVA